MKTSARNFLNLDGKKATLHKKCSQWKIFPSNIAQTQSCKNREGAQGQDCNALGGCIGNAMLCLALIHANSPSLV